MIVIKKQNISAFFPCYNDAKSIGKLVKDVDEVLKKYAKNYEIIVIDDASIDNSRKVLLELSKKYEKLKLVFHDQNLGYGGALRSGFNKASYDLIFYTDGDGQYTPKELPVLLLLMSPDVDFINGIKMTRNDAVYRVVIGNLYSFMARWIFWLPIHDVDCDFRLIRKTIVKSLQLTSTSGSICIELVKKAQRSGAKFRQVSVHHYERQWGQSQFFKVGRIMLTLFEITKLWFLLMFIDRVSTKGLSDET